MYNISLDFWRMGELGILLSIFTDLYSLTYFSGSHSQGYIVQDFRFYLMCKPIYQKPEVYICPNGCAVQLFSSVYSISDV